MISYYDGQLTDIMPGHLTNNAEIRALSFALQQACRLLYNYSQRVYIYSNLDIQPEEIVDILAQELRTQYYSSALDIQTKRNLVKNTLVWHMHAGTPAAVEELVRTVFGKGEVEEWFQYGGQPYNFKIITDTIITNDIIQKFGNLIKKVKNTRSHLEAITITRQNQGNIYVANCMKTCKRSRITEQAYREEE